MTLEMHCVTYSMSADYGRTCAWCDEDATYKIDALPAHLIDYVCDSHVAEHMRGNAYAIAGADENPSPREAEIMNELDQLSPLE